MSGAPQIAILITGAPVSQVLDTRGGYAEIFAALLEEDWSGEVNAFDVRDGCFPPMDSALHGVIITGSAANVPDQEPWMVVAQEWLRVLVRRVAR
jgi:GMP synthase (glutamine-hydrolysing)